MAADLRKVKPGDPLRIKADTFNSFIDAAKAISEQRIRMVPAAAGGTPGRAVLYVRNDSGVDLDWGDVLGIVGPLITPTDDETDFRLWTALMGDIPDAAVHRGRFAILTEPITAGEIGHAVVTGVIATRVRLNVAGHRFADVLDGDATQLNSVDSGAAAILWSETPGTLPDTVRAIVRIGGDGAPAKVQARVSGSSPVSANRWTYTCVEQEMTATGWQDLSGGRTFTGCRNGYEANNSATGIQGNGVNVDTLPGGFHLVPVRGGAVIEIWKGLTDNNDGWRFSEPNGVDGTCTVPIAPQQALDPTDRAYMMSMGAASSYLGVT